MIINRRKIARLFSLGLDRAQTSELVHLNRNTVNCNLTAMRVRIAEFCELESPIRIEAENDCIYFGAK